MKRTTGLNIVVKFIAAYAALVVLVTLVFTSTFYTRFSENNFRTIQETAKETAAAVAERIDFTGIETLRDPSQENSPIFERIYKDLNVAQEANPLVTFVYTMRPRPTGAWEFIVDADPEIDDNGNGMIDEDEASADIGEEYDTSCCPELAKALNGPTVDQEITSDVWGSWISGYAPIHNQAGQTVGIVGVDISADQFVYDQALIRELLITSLVITLLLSLLFGLGGFYSFQREGERINRALRIRNEELEKQVKIRILSQREFMARIVHELRSPLTALRWNIETLGGSKCTKSERELLAAMSESAKEMTAVVNDFLDASKLATKKLTLNKEAADIAEISKAVANELSAQAKSKNLTLSVEIKNKPPKFSFDKARISQVMRNLISNAIKYTDKGGIEIILDYLPGSKRVRAEVRDTGIGISKPDREKLFQSFIRVGKGRETGTGLGLVIAKGIVDGHDGKIGVDSKKGKGSTFWFEIPTKQ